MALIMTPLTLGEHRKLGRSRKELTPLLVGIAMSADLLWKPAKRLHRCKFRRANFLDSGMLYLVFFRMIFGKEKKEEAVDQEANGTEAQMMEMKFGDGGGLLEKIWHEAMTRVKILTSAAR